MCMFFKTTGVSDLYKMKDVVTISEEHCGRMVQLNYQWWPQTMYSSGNFKGGEKKIAIFQNFFSLNCYDFMQKQLLFVKHIFQQLKH